jgi:hypothetical protein
VVSLPAGVSESKVLAVVGALRVASGDDLAAALARARIGDV